MFLVCYKWQTPVLYVLCIVPVIRSNGKPTYIIKVYCYRSANWLTVCRRKEIWVPSTSPPFDRQQKRSLWKDTRSLIMILGSSQHGMLILQAKIEIIKPWRLSWLCSTVTGKTFFTIFIAGYESWFRGICKQLTSKPFYVTRWDAYTFRKPCYT